MFADRFDYLQGYNPYDHTFSLKGRPIQWQSQAPDAIKNNLARYFFERSRDEAYYDGFNSVSNPYSEIVISNA